MNQPVSISTPRTRLAPTPSGFLHLGNVLSFVITASIAAAADARIFLRIDDMDRNRVRPEYIQDIFDTLRFLDLPWQDGPVSVHDFEAHFAQQHRMPHYKAALAQLEAGGHLYACTCSRTDILKHSPNGAYLGTCRKKGLDLRTPGCAWRLKTDADNPVRVNGLAGDVQVAQLPPLVHDFVVRKKDGCPAYQLSSVVDDVLFGVNLVVRGADLWESTLAQLYLARLLGASAFEHVRFLHHPLLLQPDGNKLSKSAGATSVWQMRRQEATKADVFSAVAQFAGTDSLAADWSELGLLLRKQFGINYGRTWQ